MQRRLCYAVSRWRWQSSGILVVNTTANSNVTVANNLVAQELGFQREDLIKKLARLSPDEPITGIRFRVGNVS